MESGNDVVTGKGKGKDQYGRAFCKKQKAAMLEFTKTMWLQDATNSLRNLLTYEVAQRAFMDFLKQDYGEAQLEFFLEATKMDDMDQQAQADAAVRIYKMFMCSGGKGIGQETRTQSTQQVWDFVNGARPEEAGDANRGDRGDDDRNSDKDGVGSRNTVTMKEELENIDPATAMIKIREEAEVTLNMLAFDAFPRFIKSPLCIKVLQGIDEQSGSSVVEGMLQGVHDKAPQDADDWLNMFVATAESFPASIVISDMTIPGAPMVFVNKAFCRTTGYTKEEATGRNCRFLQGPDTEPDAIQVIRNTLCKGVDCHVKLTNYRKNGEKFQNLLSMRPIFDADNIYRYVVGVQFEIKEDSNLRQRLVQLDKLIHLLPSKLNLRSKESSRVKGSLAVKVTGEANTLINHSMATKDSTAQIDSNVPHPCAEAGAMSGNGTIHSKTLYSPPLSVPMSKLNLDNVIFAFTKMMWLNKSNDTMREIALDPIAKVAFAHFCKLSTLLYWHHFDFVCKFLMIVSTQGQEQVQLIRKLHMKKEKNSLFYCTANHIPYGSFNSTNWGPIFQEMVRRSKTSISMLSEDVLPKFLNSRLAFGTILKIRAREMSGQQSNLCTVAAGLDKNSDSVWLDMFKRMSETVSCGMVISDMSIPGLPLVYINEGFKNTTGYGKEKIGTSCRFLQGKDTETYLNDEIMFALQQAEPLLVKLHNYKADGQKFQCLLALIPIMGHAPDYEYKFQIGMQIDMTLQPDITHQLLEMERCLQCIPRTMCGDSEEDLRRCIPRDLLGDETMLPKVQVPYCDNQKRGIRKPNEESKDINNDVVTGKGKGKDQYGRAFCKKQKAAMLEFTKTMWLQDATNSLRNLLTYEVAQRAFMDFLKQDYGEAQLEFFLEATKMDDMDQQAQADAAVRIYKMFMCSGGKGIGQETRTQSTQQVWDFVNGARPEEAGDANRGDRGDDDRNSDKDGVGSRNTVTMKEELENIDPATAMIKIREEAEVTLNMLAFDAFPRFIKSPLCIKVLQGIDEQSGSSVVEGMLQGVHDKAPQDADDWLNMFVATAESFPASIVISDMTIPGAPMVFVNKAFCRTTGYTKEEATGRNCRFLQGPDTEPDAIQVIRNTLCKGVDCHVKLTNYRKNGEKFQNLLSMRPIFDADNIYRYVVGVQFEIKEDSNLRQRLVQLDKLIHLLPSKLNLRSKESSRVKGSLAAMVTGEANTPSRQELNYDRTLAAFTKIMWLQDPVSSCRCLLLDPLGREYFTKFAKEKCGSIVNFHLKFCSNTIDIREAPASRQLNLIRKYYSKRRQNPMYYCSTNETKYGTLDHVDWTPILETMSSWYDQSINLLAREAFPRFLEHSLSNDYIFTLRDREGSTEGLPIHTAAYGVNPNSPNFWLDMFKRMSETVSCGMVISDMSIPGLPLVYINEGFKNTTGYGKEKIGTSCRFLQGKDTETYLNDEIMFALQQAEPLLVKLHNYKADGQKFQCLLALIPIMGHAPDYEYKFQIGMQIDFNPRDPDLPKKIAEMGRVLRMIPQSTTGEKPPNVDAVIMETLDSFSLLNDSITDVHENVNVNVVAEDATESSFRHSHTSPQRQQSPTSASSSFSSPRHDLYISGEMARKYDRP